jgi:outer membrane protein assembly factor BamB
VRIAAPDTAAPGDTVLLAGSGNDPVRGALPATSLIWSIGDSEVARGYQALVVMPPSGSVVVTLEASDSTGSHADTSHTITVAGRGAALWRTSLPSNVMGFLTTLTYSPDDHTLYVSGNGSVVALAREATYRWRVAPVISLNGPPAVRPGGLFYLTDVQRFNALDNTGGSQWEDSLAFGAWGIGSDGVAIGFSRYAGNPALVRLGPTGAILQHADVIFGSPSQSNFFIDRSGTAWSLIPVVVVSYPSGATVGHFEFNAPCGSGAGMLPGVGGSIVLTSSSCISANTSSGGLQWTSAPTGFTIVAPPAVGRDGTLYFGLSNGAVVAMAPGGAERWRSSALPTGCGGAVNSVGTPAIGADGTVFYHAGGRLVALDAGGTQLWVRPTVSDTTLNGCAQQTSVLLTSDGWLFTFTTFDGGSLVSAFAAGTVADTLAPWGQYLSDERHSRRAH